MFNSAAPGVLLAGAGALFCGITHNSPLCVEAGQASFMTVPNEANPFCARASLLLYNQAHGEN